MSQVRGDGHDPPPHPHTHTSPRRWGIHALICAPHQAFVYPTTRPTQVGVLHVACHIQHARAMHTRAHDTRALRACVMCLACHLHVTCVSRPRKCACCMGLAFASHMQHPRACACACGLWPALAGHGQHARAHMPRACCMWRAFASHAQHARACAVRDLPRQVANNTSAT